MNAAALEWSKRAREDLQGYWPESSIPFGHMTHQRQPLPQHGYLMWSDMFNPRQLLVLAQLLAAIVDVESHGYSWTSTEYVLSAFQQYLRNQNMFCFWNPQRDTPEPMFSNANFHPKAIVIENCVFPKLGRGNWNTCSSSLLETIDWSRCPWELVSNARLGELNPNLRSELKGKSDKVFPRDPVCDARTTLICGSATELAGLRDAECDLVITDPPFGGNLHYAELADFFYVWLRLALLERHP